MGSLFREDTEDVSSDFMVDYGLVVLKYDVDADFLSCEVNKDLKG
jgi:hypothetical protein